jgi:uncharacterized protein YcbK (DUF882 family)
MWDTELAMPPYVRSIATLALTLVPAIAAASTHAHARLHKHRSRARAASEAKPRGCVKAPVEVVVAAKSTTFPLTKCDGTAEAGAVDQLSTLAQAPGAHRLDARLVAQLGLAADHFRKSGEPVKVVLVSGYRPRGEGNYHSSGRAVDFRIEGVDSEALASFCKTLPDTGCGYYPNSAFVHMDVRSAHTGHVAWTDVSRSGDPPHYVTTEAPPLPALPPPPDEEETNRQGASSPR